MKTYAKVKSKFLKLEKGVGREEKKLLSDAKKFFAFSLFLIVAALLYYSKTGDEVLPFLALFATAVVFWEHSDKTGKILMVAAASIGYIHEVVGGMEGWFVYTSGVFYQTPLWLIPGYAAMYWACYNLWKRGSKKYKIREKNFILFAASLIALFFVLDATALDLRPVWVLDLCVLALLLMLFRIPGDRHFAFITLCMTAFNELLGVSLGAWQHYLYPGQVSTLAGHVDIFSPAATGFSFIGLMPSYIIFLWGSIRFAEYVTERKKPLKREFVILGALLAIKAWSWLSSSTILAALA